MGIYSLFSARTDEDAEMWCDRCERRHGVNWCAPSDLWNAVMREGQIGNPDEFGFCCPSCFMELADERGVGNHLWVVVPDPLTGPYGTVPRFFEKAGRS